MNTSDIITILNDWNFWRKAPFTGIPRPDYLKKMHRFAGTGQIVVVSGVRRSGKSTLLLQYLDRLIRDGLEPRNTLYVNLEDPRFHGDLSPALLQKVYEAFVENLQPQKPFVFIDEVQNVAGWERFVRALHERKAATVFVSGSSSKLLSAELGSVLTGRHLTVEVFPLDFTEFLRFRGVQAQNRLSLAENRFKIKACLKEYMEFGGFPQVVLSQEKKELLVRYFEDVLTRDVAQRYRIRKTEKLKALALYCLANFASLVSFNRIGKFLGLSLDTVERFSNFLSSSGLLFFTKKFAYSLKEQEVNPRKVFAVDSGLRNAVSLRLSEDVGKCCENIVWLHMQMTGKEVYYWRNKAECDFLVKEKRKLLAIQVTSAFDNPQVRDRELNGLLAAVKKFNLRSGLVIDSEWEGEDRISGKKITIVPLWKWLLRGVES